MINDFSCSDVLCKRAQQIIPGGAHTYSKGADQSPLLGPKFMDHGLAGHVWDVDGNEYIDWAMGLSSVSIGHCYEPVLSAVRAELARGSNFQCPSPKEVELAELFLREVPGAEMVKFAKNGSTVTTAAVKLARAYTGRKYVAYCSDHGFFSYDDWFMAKKPNNAGIPEEISNLSLTFRYNDMASVEELFATYPGQIACVILEPMEFDYPEDKFLHKIKNLCNRDGAVFVLDEMITGFRLAYPGAHRLLDIEADMTTWGKGVANGFSVCVLAGKKEILDLGGITHKKDRVFLISTTHGAEIHSLAAAIATINAVKSENSIERNTATGKVLQEAITKEIQKSGLTDFISIKGHPCWQLLQFRNGNKEFCDGYKTLVFQEFIKHGVLFRGSFVTTISHTEEDVQNTVSAFSSVLKVYSSALNSGGYEKHLVGDPVKPVFRKRN